MRSRGEIFIQAGAQPNFKVSFGKAQITKLRYFKKLYNEDKMLKEERDKQFIENKFANKIKEVLVCTFQPNLENSKHFHSKSNSQTTGSLYDRAVLWKEHQSKWVEDQLKIKEIKAQQEVIGRHIEDLKHSRMYYDNMRLMHQNLT